MITIYTITIAILYVAIATLLIVLHLIERNANHHPFAWLPYALWPVVVILGAIWGTIDVAKYLAGLVGGNTNG